MSGGIFDQVCQIISLHGELVRGAALSSTDADILSSLENQGTSRHPGKLRPEARDNLIGGLSLREAASGR